MFPYILAGLYVLFFLWYLYRSGYEDGRKFELEREMRRLDAESKRLEAESKRLRAESEKMDEELGTYGGPYQRHPKYPPGRDSKD